MIKRYILPILFFGLFILSSVRLSPYIRQAFLSAGLLQEEVFIAGTGSMYPTFPKGEGESDVVRAQEIVAWPKMRRYSEGFNLFGFRLFSYDIKHGDIVEFENEKTVQISKEKYGEEAGFVKRVIALAGDNVELRDGFVKLNGSILEEPYTAKPRSSYGGEFLPDCKTLKVPDGQVFVLGDNRKASFDSRFELGPVNISDIKYVLPWREQEEYKQQYRDTKDDLTLAHTTTLDNVEFVNLLNVKRKEKNLPPLAYNVLLTNSGKIRGQAMIKANDFSTEATESGVTLSTSIKKSGYRNIIFAEVFTRGFYEAEELLENFLEFPDTQKILFSSGYQDIGLSPVLGEIDSCPVQVVVVHFGGFIPPDYSQEELDSWAKLSETLEKVIPSWEAARAVEGIDKEKLNRLISVLNTRLSNSRKILSRMRANQWLTDEERKLVDEDKRLSEEGERIIAQLGR